ncbi:MAG: dockerin type I domain-containing protein [Candidatus Poribacteria bacterium]|nr:dockerin type I domain-containing protein [Candidatus Poribacteria bacterium]
MVIYFRECSFLSLLLLYIFGLYVGNQVATADEYDHDTTLNYIWEPASGPVHHYNIYVSVDGGEFELVGTTVDATPEYALTDAKDRSTYRLQVQAVDAAGNVGPLSDPSDPITVDLQEDDISLRHLDVNQDGQIDIFDLVVVGARLGEESPPDTLPNPDVNRDGVVNVFDLVLIGQAFGKQYETELAAPTTWFAAETVHLAFQPRMLLEGFVFVEIIAQSESEMHGFQFDVHFDPNHFEAITVEEGQLLGGDGSPTYWHPPAIENETGDIRNIASSRLKREGVLGKGMLAGITFKIKATDFGGRSPAHLSPASIGLSNVRLVNASGGRLTAAILTSIDWETLIPPEKSKLLPNYPNPFNPETWIPYALSQDSDVQIRIYDLRGHLVRTFALGHQAAGWYRSRESAVYWNGRNTVGEPVASGIYVYHLVTPHFQQIRRMVILK